MPDHQDLINSKSEKQWWAPVWKGLVMDEKAKHYRRMKNAIWLFLYLLLNANRKTGFLLRKVKTISSDMAVHRNTVFRWLNTLRTQGYIATENTGRCLHIRIEKWKGIAEIEKAGQQKQQTCNPQSTKSGTSLKADKMQNPVHLGPKKAVFGGPNDSTINKNILKNDIDSDKFLESNCRASKQFKPRGREELLALDLAEELNDRQGLPFYLSCSKRYPESLLREVLSEVKQVPAEKINKSRAALFNHLIQQYDQKDSQNHSS